ncbi:hypothetical protein J5N97_002370 [Dioscorea zingiberensis]|uniref:Uncharacterized protein n=1 Tax=Dioscorea zingiberensis TaxID=325984 RepID=A0A9D5D3L2_9LILI|nr:hypothetical protein J5N97_002370 [Dioscorea zingiberensis]
MAATQSFNWNQEISSASVEFTRKRKLQYEFSLPLPKLKFRERSASSDHDEPNKINATMMFDEDNNIKQASTETFHEDQSSTSSTSCNNNNALKNAIYSLDSSCSNKEKTEDSELAKTGLEIDEEYENEEDIMLYSNEFMLSDIGARKPTIDQEFEQYFAMLML